MSFKTAILSSLASALVVVAFNVNAYTLDFSAINDDDDVNNYSTNALNYTMDGYKKTESNLRGVQHDPNHGIYQEDEEDYDNDNGLKLKGVNKSDPQDLYYGTEMYRR